MVRQVCRLRVRWLWWPTSRLTQLAKAGDLPSLSAWKAAEARGAVVVSYGNLRTKGR